jgi:hypothetical protein
MQSLIHIVVRKRVKIERWSKCRRVEYGRGDSGNEILVLPCRSSKPSALLGPSRHLVAESFLQAMAWT